MSSWERHDQEEFLRYEHTNGDIPEEPEMTQPGDKRFLRDTPKPYNPYQSGIYLPEVTDEEMAKRAAYYDAQWRDTQEQRRRSAVRHLGYRESIRFANVLALLMVLGVIGVGWFLYWAFTR